LPENEAQQPLLLLEPQDERANLLPYFRLLWENRLFVFRFTAVAFLASALIAFLIPSRYRAITRLMPPDNQSSSGLGILAAIAGKSGAGSSGLASLGGFAGDLLSAKSTGALFVGVLASQTVQDRLIEDFNLRKVYWDSKIEDARTDLARNTDITEERKSGIITIGVTDHDPKRSAEMAHTYVTELDRLVAQVSTSSARRERIFLEDRLKTVKTDLDLAAKNFSSFASKNTAIDIPAQGKAMVEAAANLQGRMIAAQSELSGLQQVYTNNNVRVRAAQARVNELQHKLNEIGGGDYSNGAKEADSLYPSIRKLPILGVTYADLYLQTKIQETVYELLTQQYETAKIQEAKEIPSVKVLDVAVIPTKQSFPPRILLTILGTMMGFAAAMSWIIAKNRWDQTDDDNPRRVLAAEVFTAVRAKLSNISRIELGASSNGNSGRSRNSSSGNQDEAKRNGKR
jgi:uncharacterized protein involved in exopolysaccharide biosynthesis